MKTYDILLIVFAAGIGISGIGTAVVTILKNSATNKLRQQEHLNVQTAISRLEKLSDEHRRSIEERVMGARSKPVLLIECDFPKKIPVFFIQNDGDEPAYDLQGTVSVPDASLPAALDMILPDIIDIGPFTISRHSLSKSYPINIEDTTTSFNLSASFKTRYAEYSEQLVAYKERGIWHQDVTIKDITHGTSQEYHLPEKKVSQ